MKPLVVLFAAAALASTAAPLAQAFQAPTKTKKAAATAKTDASAKVEVVGLSLEKAVESEQPGQPMRFGQFVTGGTSVTLLVSHPGKTILGLDEKKSRMTSFTDDKKTDLLKAKPKPKNQGVVVNFGPVDGSPFKVECRPGGHSCWVKVVGPTLPAPGASKLTVRGHLVLNCAATEKTVEHKNVALTNGTRIKAGSIPITVVAGQPGAGFALEVDGPLSALKSVTFFDADGKELKSRNNGTSSYTIGATTRSSQSYSLEKPVAKATVRVTYFDTEELIVPLDVAVGVGF
jgi:hypothetical protein